MAVLREILAKFGIDFDKQGAKEADNSIVGLVERFSGLIKVAAAALSGGVVFHFTKQMIDLGDQAGKAAIKLGLGAVQLQRWQFAAGQAGLETTEFDDALRTLQQTSFEAHQGVEGFTEVFSDLGVEVNNSAGELKTIDVLVREVGLALNGTENSSKRTALALKLMGDVGGKLLPLFAGGAEGLDTALSRFDEFGGGFSKDFTDATQNSLDRFSEFELAILSLKAKITLFILPAFDFIISKLAKLAVSIGKFVVWIQRSIEAARVFKAILIALGLALSKSIIAKLIAGAKAAGRFLVTNKKLLLSIARVAAKFLFWTAIIDDLITFLEGGESATGKLIDKLFGVGAAETTLNNVKKAAQLLGDTVSAVGALIALWRADTEEETEAARVAFEKAAQGIVDFWDPIFAWFGEMWGKFKETVSLVGDALLQVFADMVSDTIKEFALLFTGVEDGFDDWLSGLSGKLAGFVKEVFDIGGHVSRAFGGIFGAGVNVGQLPGTQGSVAVGSAPGGGALNQSNVINQSIDARGANSSGAKEVGRAVAKATQAVSNTKRATLAALRQGYGYGR